MEIAQPLALDDDVAGVEARVGSDYIDLGFDLAAGHGDGRGVAERGGNGVSSRRAGFIGIIPAFLPAVPGVSGTKRWKDCSGICNSYVFLGVCICETLVRRTVACLYR